MKKQKCRTIKELYAATKEILEPKITPVLRGSYRMQGPVDEADHEVQKNTRSSQAETRSDRSSLRGRVRMRTESGTCNVCAAPCSSCMHFNRAMSCMELKTENEFSDENSRVKGASRCSFNDAKVLSPFKNRARKNWHHTSSETSNLLSASSSHDSFSENAESKATRETFEATEGAEMFPKVSSGGTVAKNKLHSKPLASDMDEVTISIHHQQKGLECVGDSVSCISGANDAKPVDGDLSDDVDRKTILRSAAYVTSSIPEPEGCLNQVNIQLKRADSDLEKEESCGKSGRVDMLKKEILQNQLATEDAMDLDVDSCTQNVGGHNSVAHSSNDEAHPNVENCRPVLNRSSSSGSGKIYPCTETGVGMDTVEQAKSSESMKCLDENEKTEKLKASPELPDTREPPVQSHLNDETDDSDMVEDDVKVCDICGDAGREESLAFCSRCSDGAEHTYCMQVMMDKVPEGDWLCEECKMKEEAENQKHDKFEAEAGALKTSCTNGKTQNTGNSEQFPKRDVKPVDVDANRSTKVAANALSSKRRPEGLEFASPAKRQALEVSVGSPKPSNSSKKPALSRETSFKNLEKGKVKPFHIIPTLGGNLANNSQGSANSPTAFAHNSLKTQPLLQSPRGTLLKSNSFNTNNKPKIKLVEENVSQKHKLVRERAAGDIKKEGIIKTVSKSASFRTASPHPSSTEAKAKVHCSNSSRSEDIKGLKLSKERMLERKSSFKSDRFLASSPAGSNASTSKTEHKVSSRGEQTPMLSVVSKSIQTEVKLNNSSKINTLPANRGLDTSNVQAGRVDFKRQSSILSRGAGSLSLNGNAEQKPSLVSSKEEPVTNHAMDGQYGKSDATQREALPQSRESSVHDRKVLEPSFSQSRQSAAIGDKTTRCHKCKELGHAAQFCPVSNLQSPSHEASLAQSSRELRKKSTKFIDAVEAALQKRPVMYKRNKVPDHSDDFSVSSTELSCEGASKDQLSTSSNCLRNLKSSNEVYDGKESLKSSTADSIKSMSGNIVKSHTLHPTEAECFPKERESDATVPLDGNNLKHCVSDMANLASPFVPLRLFSIPDHNYIWQGGFHVKRRGRPMDLCDGIQGHLSTCASPKVPEVVSKFSQRIMLEEVSRLSTWPVQFQNCATEDNIALYFFAKDHESYARSYKSLLENMIKNDLALKGNFDGVELLIFPSNVLPEKSQRWNMLFFLWGVFRGRKTCASDHFSWNQKKLSGADLNVSSLEPELLGPVDSVSQEGCSSINIDNLHPFDQSQGTETAIKSNASVHLPISSYSGRVDLNCCLEECSIDDKDPFTRSSLSADGNALDSNSMLKASRIQAHASEEVHKEEHFDHQVKEHAQTMVTQEVSFKDTSFGSLKVLAAGVSVAQHADANILGVKAEDKPQEKIENRRCQVKHEIKLKEEPHTSDAKITAKSLLPSDSMEKDCCTGSFKYTRKRPYSASLGMAVEAFCETSTSASEEMPFQAMEDCIMVSDDDECKKVKRCSSEINVSDSSKDENAFRSQMHNLVTNFPVKDQKLDVVHGGTMVPGSSGTAERYFFPVDLSPMNDNKPRGNQIPVHILSSDDEDQLEPEAPNLDLALGGAERRPPKKQVVLPLFSGLEDRKIDLGKHPDSPESNREDGLLASLSLSLAFPFPDKEQQQHVKPVSKPPEQLLPDGSRHGVDTSLLLFGGFPNT